MDQAESWTKEHHVEASQPDKKKKKKHVVVQKEKGSPGITKQ